MSSYQKPDPLHGRGKAVPHPKLPTTSSRRGGGTRWRIVRFPFPTGSFSPYA